MIYMYVKYIELLPNLTRLLYATSLAAGQLTNYILGLYFNTKNG